jgi:hypothetical protein
MTDRFSYEYTRDNHQNYDHLFDSETKVNVIGMKKGRNIGIHLYDQGGKLLC